MYLSFVSSDTLPHDFKLRLAVDISLAALLGDSIYSFGQLLLHPIVHVLDDSPFRCGRKAGRGPDGRAVPLLVQRAPCFPLACVEP